MIAYLEGKIFRNSEEGLILLVNGIGYEILLPEITFESFKNYKKNDIVSLFIYYHQTERQPSPILIGFENEKDKNFFKKFISVEDIGVIKAVKALTIPVNKIIAAIELEDQKTLLSLKGIGKRTAGKIIATLKGRFGDITSTDLKNASELSSFDKPNNLIESVKAVMVSQLGHPLKEAENLIRDALKRKPDISDFDDLIEEIYKKSGRGNSK
ncbi:MAG: Holliday junction branch migration protein RuvA [Desulforegulaceae bacterium]|jgi:Holliday junction DNA helicase RuvA|nr:Holliday junction branch migration protein RuvA [Desulforegulaceae bacterium]